MARHELGRALGELVQKNHQIEKSTLHKPYGAKRLRVSKCSPSKVDEKPANLDELVQNLQNENEKRGLKNKNFT